MNDILQQEKLEKIASFNGIDIFNIKMGKFKTNSINIFFHDNLDRVNVTKNALLPAVLRRGCESYPTFKDIALYLEELYGASFDCGVTKKGEYQLIQFYIEFVSDRFAAEDDNVFEKAFELLTDIISKPIIENNSFKSEYVDQEKENLRMLIESRVNDKMQYSLDRCYEEMCKKEPFGIYEYGYVPDLEPINGKELFDHYKYFLETLPVSVFITGDVEADKISKLLNKLSLIKRGTIKDLRRIETVVERKEVVNIEEKMDVNQGKLSLGFRTGVTAEQSGYYPLLVYNSILGGGMHSKLFQNVRERESLAYYVFSRLDKFKGLMIVSGGIESINREKAQNIILEQIEDIKKGNISDYEFESAIKTIETGIKSLKDNQLHVMDFYLSQVIGKTNDTLDTIVEKVKKVNKNDIANVSVNINLDTVYFLTK